MQSLKQPKQKIDSHNYIHLDRATAAAVTVDRWHVIYHKMIVPQLMAVEGKPFLAMIKGHAEDTIRITVDGDVFARNVPLGRVSTLSPLTPPDIVGDPIAAARDIDMHRAARFAGKDDVRSYLNGVLIDFTGEGLNVVATDGHRLYIQERATPCTTPLQSIIPTEAVTRISKQGSYLVLFYEDQIHATFDGGYIIANTIGGSYPDYRRTIPTSSAQTLTAPRKPLIAALKQIRHSLAKATDGVIFTENRITTRDSVAFVPIDTTGGESVRLGINHKYLLDAVTVLESDNITIEYTSDVKALVLTDHDTKVVTMPCRIES